MKLASVRRLVIPPGPILSLTLVGLLLLSGLLYYRAVKIQRFLEPALALSQPRNEFADAINSALRKEFDAEGIKGVSFTLGTIYVDDALLFDGQHNMRDTAPIILRKLGNTFHSILSDEHTRSHVDLILVVARFPVSDDPEVNRRMRLVQYKSELILDTMFRERPDLEKEHGGFFAATYLPMNDGQMSRKGVVFRIIPSEQLHIDVLQRLRKYVH
ncbi:MAG: hypothetical protein HZA17_01945 [Nitrospirae bacterium]|nr:hypothetical protein [Nitrospirota bacterium]